MISRRRHVVKAITWRCLATFDTVIIAWWVTGDWQVGVQVGAIEVVTKLALYYLHERFWYKFIRFGVVVAQPE